MAKETKTLNGVKTVYSINSVRNIGQIHAKNEITPASYMIHNNKLKMGKGLQC